MTIHARITIRPERNWYGKIEYVHTLDFTFLGRTCSWEIGTDQTLLRGSYEDLSLTLWSVLNSLQGNREPFQPLLRYDLAKIMAHIAVDRPPAAMEKEGLTFEYTPI